MRACRNISALPVMVIMLGCAGDIESRTSSPIDRQSLLAGAPQELSIVAFEKHLMPELGICAGCHGSTQAPLFAVSDAMKAHQAITEGGKVDFNNVSRSRLVLRLTEDEHNCVSDCQAEGKRFSEAIAAWRDELESTTSLANSNGGGMATTGFNPKGSRRLRYEIGNLISDEYGNETIMLQMDIEPLAAGGGYALTNLQVDTLSESVYVKGIKPLIGGVWDSLNSSLTGVACAIHPPASKLFGFENTTVLVEDMGADNRLSFVFEELRIAVAGDESCEKDNEMSEEEILTLAQKKNEFEQSMRENFGRYCSCHDYYFKGDTAFNRAWTSRVGMAERIDAGTENRVMPPLVGAAQMPADVKEDMLEWLND